MGICARRIASASPSIKAIQPCRSSSRTRCLAQILPRGTPVSGQTPDCLFCTLFHQGYHVAKTEGFVAIRDINPKAETHLLVIPERHIETFRDVSELTADEAKRMLDFVAEVARGAGLEDYRVLVNVGPGGGQTIFHLHWHVLGGKIQGMPA
jgi:histidine triad (HIT) family protein